MIKTCSKCNTEKDEDWKTVQGGEAETCRKCRDYNRLYKIVKTPGWNGIVPADLEYLWREWQREGRKLEFKNRYDELCFDCMLSQCVRLEGDINRASDHKYPGCLISIARIHDIEPQEVVSNIKVTTRGLQLSQKYGNILIT